MNFLDPVFLLFFPAAFAAVHATPRRYRYLPLLAASYLFYGWRTPAVTVILLLCTVWTWAGGAALGKAMQAEADGRAPAFWFSPDILFRFFFLSNILLLAVFKYTGFFSAALGHPLDLAAPVGLSFYIFQSSGYLGSIRRRELPPERNLLRYAAFVSFFPTLLSGPIQRAPELLPQLQGRDRTALPDYRAGFLLFLWGLFGKLVVSARLSAVTSAVFASPDSFSGIACLLAAVLLSFYIYVDFASYSDIAAGCACMLGFPVAANFRTPFLASSLKEFWNRWHISLNRWFIENVYIPLGGSRKGALRRYRNVLLVFLLSGAWHGSAGHFVVWGGLNGAAMILEELLSSALRRRRPAAGAPGNGGRLSSAALLRLRRLAVLLVVSLNFIFFGAASVRDALRFLARILSIRLPDIAGFMPTSLFGWDRSAMYRTAAALLFFLLVQYQRHEEGAALRRFRRLPAALRHILPAVILTLCIFAACARTSRTDTAFLYYRF